MDTGIYIVRTFDGEFLMNTSSHLFIKKLKLPYSQGDGQLSGFTFTEEEKTAFISRLCDEYGFEEGDFKVNKVYFNKNNTMVIID